MHEAFIDRKFRQDSLLLIDVCNGVIKDYHAQGYSLTLRQLYYQLVSKAVIENTKKSYDKLGSLLSNARLAGLVDWSAIEDRTRNVVRTSTWDSPSELVQVAMDQYKEDLWEEQHFHVEVWVEKEALSGIVEDACEEYRVPYLACRGYMSQSEQYSAAKRFEKAVNAGREVCAIHLGDHDPSGIDMTRDNQDRLKLMAWDIGDIQVKRIALSMEQVEELKPPPNPAKQTDRRFEGYRELYGEKSWELDALKPGYLHNLIRHHISLCVNEDDWQAGLDRESDNKDRLQAAVDSLD